MPNRVVKQPNGKLAIFSTVVDDFTLMDAAPEDIIEDFMTCHQMSRGDALVKLQRGLDDEDMPAPFNLKGPEDGLRRWRDALETIRFRHGRLIALDREVIGKSDPPLPVVWPDQPITVEATDAAL